MFTALHSVAGSGRPAARPDVHYAAEPGVPRVADTVILAGAGSVWTSGPVTIAAGSVPDERVL